MKKKQYDSNNGCKGILHVYIYFTDVYIYFTEVYIYFTIVQCFDIAAECVALTFDGCRLIMQ